MIYEAWRITYQSSEAAARAAYDTVEKLHAKNTALQAEIESLQARVQELGEMARENRSKKVIELEQRIAEMEEQMAAIGAGGVEPLRKRASHGVHTDVGIPISPSDAGFPASGSAAPAAVAVPDSHTQALKAIAEWPVTDMLLNMDAANMRGIAQRALAATQPEAQGLEADLTDEQIDEAFNQMPDGAYGFLKSWGYRQFARAVLAAQAKQGGAANG